MYIKYLIKFIIYICRKIFYYDSKKKFIPYLNSPNKPDYYIKTTGTTSDSKLISFYNNSELSKLTIILPALQEKFLYGLLTGKCAFLFKKNKITYIDNIICSNGITKQINSLTKTNFFKFISAIPTNVYDNLDYSLDVQIIHMLLESNLTVIFGYFARPILEQFDNIINNHKYYINCIVQGKINNYYFQSNVVRALELENIFNNNNRKGIIKKIWINLQIIVCAASGIFNIYKPRLNYYTDYTLIYSPICACTEVNYGINILNDSSDIYAFNYDECFIHTDEHLKYSNGKFLRLTVSTKNYLNNYLIDDIIEPMNHLFIYHGRFGFYNEFNITEKQFSELIIKNSFSYDLSDILIIKSNSKYTFLYETYDQLFDISNLIKLFKLYSNKKISYYIHVKYGQFNKLTSYIKDSSSNDQLCREQLKLPRILYIDENEKHNKYYKILIN